MRQTASQIIAPATCVTITVNGNLAHVEAPSADLVAPVLQRQGYEFDLSGPTGVKHRKLLTKHYAGDQRDRLYFFAGLVGRVTRALKARGCQVVVDDRTDCKWLHDAERAAKEFTDVTEEEQRFAAAICGSPHGQLVTRNTEETAWAIALMLDVFPKLNLIVVTKNKLQAGLLHRLITEHTDRPIALYPQLPWKMGMSSWAIIGTGQLFSVCDLDPWNLVIFADVDAVRAKGAAQQLETRRDFLCYCFVPSNRRLSDDEQFRVEELVGPEIFRQPNTGPQPAAVNVLMIKAPPAPKGNYNGALERKRGQIWHHDELNQLMAETAKGIQRGHSRKLIEQGLLTEDQSRAIFDQHHHPSVAILVECNEHAKQLHGLLPDWELRSGRKQVDWLPTVAGREISTLVYADRFGVRADVLISALGTPLCLSARAFPRRSLRPGPDRVVLVDFYRDACGRAGRDLQRQITEYQERGWRVIH
jgi:hypothetical protein